MMRRLVAVFLLIAPLHAEEWTPEWMWIEDVDGPRVFSHGFWLDEPVTDFARDIEEVVLTVTADFATVDIVVNGAKIGELEAYDPVTEFSILEHFAEGENEIELIAHPVEGPSAVAAAIQFRKADGSESAVATTSGEWNGEGRGPVHPHRWAFNHLPEVPPSAEYNQWKEALDDPAAKTISPLPPGFTLTKIYEAKPDEDSWVSMVIEENGHILVGQEQKGILRLKLIPDGSTVAWTERVEETLEECRGLVYAGDTLYANANDSKALYRLRDTTGDGKFDEVVEVKATTGSVGHGRNDLALGPDGFLHSIQGDVVDLPESAEILTAPEPGESKPLGYWAETGPDGETWTILARGLRNPYGIDFNPHGEAFTYDADNEGDVGLPFYRPSRINHLVAGANYGWQQRPGNTRSVPVYAPDSWPTTFDVGRGSPTSVKFGTKSDFPEPWKRVLFALDWAYGRIVAVHLVPRGASYYASGETFVEGRPLNVTDLDFDARGDMLFVTGGRKTKSALYRLSYEKPEREDERRREPRYDQAPLRADFSHAQANARKRIESARGPLSETDPAWTHLGDPDPWLRGAARVRLERRPVEEWRTTVAGLPEGLARLTGALALVRQGNDSDLEEAVALATAMPSDHWRRTEKLTFLRIAELGICQDPASVTGRIKDWIAQASDPVTRESVRLLALLDDPEAITIAKRLVDASRTQEDRLHYLEMLSLVSEGWTDASRASYFKTLASARTTSRGDRFMPPFFDQLIADAFANTPEDQREPLFALLEPPAEESEAPIAPRTFVHHWGTSQFSNEDFAAGDPVSDEVGLALYRAGQCHRCHVFGEHGRSVGPDLSRVGSRFGAIDLVESIVDPSAVVSEVFRNLTATLADESTVTGRLVRDDFRGSTLHLSPNPFDPTETVSVEKAKIVSLEESPVSPMPPSLINGFEKDEVVALVQWLLAGPESARATGESKLP